MSNRMNGQWRLKSRPVGMVKESDFEYVEEPVPDIGDNEFLVRNIYLAFEPAMRGWLNDVKSYVPPVQIGEVMRASSVGQVVESNNPEFQPGEFVSGMFGWQEFAVADGSAGMMGRLSKVPEGVAPELMLSALGGTGLTAYFGMLDVGKPQEGDVVVVSGAAGATGSVAGQIARIKGASKVVGIAGGTAKCQWLVNELGFDAAPAATVARDHDLPLDVDAPLVELLVVLGNAVVHVDELRGDVTSGRVRVVRGQRIHVGGVFVGADGWLPQQCDVRFGLDEL